MTLCFTYPQGMAYWWFDVAAAYKIQGRTVILDPSVDPTRPLLLMNWLSLMSKSPERVRVAACDTYAYLPGSLCQGGSERQERSFLFHQNNFLPKEWNRLLRLKMNPERILGDDRSWIVGPGLLGHARPYEVPDNWNLRDR